MVQMSVSPNEKVLERKTSKQISRPPLSRVHVLMVVGKQSSTGKFSMLFLAHYANLLECSCSKTWMADKAIFLMKEKH